MKVQVQPHNLTIEKTEEINAGEYNITPCQFEFSQEYEGLIKKAIFTGGCEGASYPVDITNGECIIPFEVLEQTGQVLLGVYGYDKEDDRLILRYSPTPKYFSVERGSFAEGSQPNPPTPGVWDKLVDQVEQNTQDITDFVNAINGILTEKNTNNYERYSF